MPRARVDRAFLILGADWTGPDPRVIKDLVDGWSIGGIQVQHALDEHPAFAWELAEEAGRSAGDLLGTLAGPGGFEAFSRGDGLRV
jgi:hypothetical protein